jgi:hypothetical protein
VFANARRLDPDKLCKAEAEFHELEAAGIIRRSDSPWSSPLHMVRKKDGSWQPCGDYRRLNLATTHDRYPLPSILDLSNKLHSCKFYSCIDLVKGYHQIPMAAQDIPKTGHRVDQDGVGPLQRHVQAISDFPPPSGCETITAIFRYGDFSQEVPSRYRPHAAVAHRCAQGSPQDAGMAAAGFRAAKAALAAAVPLAHPAPNAILSLATDASDTHVGGVFQQLTGGRWQPLAFYSKKLSGAGTRYSTFDRELLAAFSTVRHFRFLLEGRQFRLLTDHKPLVTSLFRTMPPWSTRQQRQLSFIAEFTSDIRHTPGQENVVADALSRPPSAAAQPRPPSQQPPPALLPRTEEGLAALDRPILAAIADAQPVNFSAMAAAQRSCPEVAEMTNSSSLQITTQTVGDTALFEDVSTGVFRSLVPIQHRDAVFQSLHSIHHPGVRVTRRLIAAQFCWPQMAKAITQMARACL